MPWSARRVAFIASLVVMLCAGMAAASDLPRIGVQHQTGESPGYEENFTRVQAFVPLYGEEQQWLLFGDLLGAVDNLGAASTSAGLGFRFAPGGGGRVFGIHTHYDYREFEFADGDQGFHRWGLGAEAIGELWAARANVYVNASGRRSTGTLFQPDVRYLDRFLQIGTAQNGFAEQPHGVDYEISRLLLRPFGMPVDHEIGLGGYYWDTPRGDGNHAAGVKGRIHTWLTDSLLTYVQATHDRVFENSVNAGFIWYFGGPSTRPSARAASLAARMATPIQRQYELPVLQYAEEGALFATDPATGQRITLTHLDDDAAAGGTGSWEQPFSRLEAASLSGTDIVLVQNGTYPGDSITLSFGQRLLAVNQPHFIETAELGTILLPGTGVGGASTILNSPSNSIVLSSGTEVTGFTISGAGNNGIYGTSVQDVLIRSNAISSSGENGIALIALGGTGAIDSNTLFSNTANGLLITAAETELILTSNSVRGNSLAGIKVVANTLTGDVFGNSASRNGFTGVALLARRSMTGNIRGNTGIANGLAGLDVQAARLFGSVADNTANQNFSFGITVRGHITGEISGNTANENGSHGIQRLGRLEGSVRDNVANNNGRNVTGGGAGIFLGSSPITGDVAGNVASGNPTHGIWIQMFHDFPGIRGNLINNVANNNGMNGFFVGGGVGGSVSGNTANSNRHRGMLISGSESRIGGNLSGNTANGNGAVPFIDGTGIYVSLGRGIGGDVTSNTAQGNRDAGMLINIFGAGVDFAGNVAGNTTNENGLDGFGFTVADDFVGNFVSNTANLNGEYGFNTFAGGTVSGTTTGNAASGNGLADFNGNIAQP